MIVQNKDKWLTCKHYLHIDKPFGIKDAKSVKRYVTNPVNIAKHPFLPLIRREVKTYPYKRDSGVGTRKIRKKIRALTFASHIDAAIYGYYAQTLQQKYEDRLVEYHLQDVPTAYRSIKDEKTDHNKCNIDFAWDVFQYIKCKITTDNPLAVITFDIKGFFDNLDHELLKKSWMDCLGIDRLPDDVYAVFKSVTHYSYIFEDQLFWLFHDKIKCRRKDGAVVERKVKDRKYLRDKGAIAYCDSKDIRVIRNHHLIRTRSREDKKGIPQGLPISATLANVYMLDFDRAVNQHVQDLCGIYRRYSDDMIIVCPLDKGLELQNWVKDKIKEINLEIEEHKTNLFYFKMEDKEICSEHVDNPIKSYLEYLGFSFDGKNIRIKNASVGKYYAKMHRSVIRAKYFAFHINNSTRGYIFRHRLITKFTPAGKNLHKPWKKSKKKDKLFHPKGAKKWGNFFAYAWKAANTMGSDAIKHQLRKSSHKLAKQINNASQEVNSSIYKNSLRQLYTYGRIYK